MHAARAIHKQREVREKKVKVDVRRPSCISTSSRNLPRSPAVSVDNSARRSQIQNESDNLNFSYIGFIIAVFGAVPLIVGTFVEVPALWEIGLGVTLVGLFIGVVFWCTELCAEAKKFSQKKNQLSTRGKIEDSNLLQVPEKKFGNGMDSRRSSFQSDSVSLISPAVQHYTPKHHPNLPQLHNPGSRHSITQYSADFAATLGRANGHLIPPALLLRGSGRRDDGRVVSLVQPDPGLDDDSDSDAETVIEAPTSHHSNTKIIQVQSCQEKSQMHHHLSRPLLGTQFNIENEKISPLTHQHRTIRMPVMPQEVDKLQRCECGRYLLTERDKLMGIKLPGISGGSSGNTTKSNSPTPMTSSVPVPGSGSAPSAPTSKSLRENLELNLGESQDNNFLGGQDVTTPLADQPPPPPPNKIINVNPSVKIAPTVPPTPQNSSSGNDTSVTGADDMVQIDPTLSGSAAKDFLSVTSASRKKTENMDVDFNDDDDEDDGDVTPGNESGKTFHEAVVDVEDEKDKVLSELLELTDVNEEEMEGKTAEAEQRYMDPVPAAATESNEASQSAEPEETETSISTAIEANKEQFLSREGSRRRLLYQSQITSINRPTSLPLPASITDAEVTTDLKTNINFATERIEPVLVASVNEEATSVARTDANQDHSQQTRIRSGKLRENNPNLTEDMSLDELLDSIEKNQEGEVLAVVVQ